MDRILISGATGVLGSQLTKTLLKNLHHNEIICLYRKTVPRLESFETLATNGNRVKFLPCDLTCKSDVKLTIETLAKNVNTLGIHCAADVSWTKQLNDITPTNVQGSINFCKIIRDISVSPKVIYLSSAYTSTGDWNYRNTYEESKALGELEIKKRFPGIPISVFSCSLVIGHSKTGEIERFHGLYPLIKFATLFDVPFLVGRKSCLIDLVPVDWTVEQLFEMVKRHINGESNQEVVASVGDSRISLSHLIDLIYQQINKYRLETGFPDKPVPPILSYRQWLFLQRSVKIWNVKNLPARKFRYFEGLLNSYKHYIENDAVLPPRNITKQAPNPKTYFNIVADYWFNKNKLSILKRWSN
jgi:thioester reductase-like protein